jgi:3-methyladenine DNA glycosylase AlkD
MKDNIVTMALSEYETLKASTDSYIRTREIRKLSADLFKRIEDKSISNVFALCEKLFELNHWHFSTIAFDFAFRVRKQYDENTFEVFQGWLKKYCTDWSFVDDFCSHAFGELLCQNTELFSKMIKWTKCKEWWVRRAAAVILLPLIRKKRHHEIYPFQISDLLMYDEHYLVLKGYGWMLKELSQKDPDSVFTYLEKNKPNMPRAAFRYALEKLDIQSKKELMSKQ